MKERKRKPRSGCVCVWKCLLKQEATKKEGGSPALKAVLAEKVPASRGLCLANPQLFIGYKKI